MTQHQATAKFIGLLFLLYLWSVIFTDNISIWGAQIYAIYHMKYGGFFKHTNGR